MSKFIFIFQNSKHEIENLIENIQDKSILKIGKTKRDDVFNLLFLDENLKNKLVIISFDENIKVHFKKFVFSILSESDDLIELILNDTKIDFSFNRFVLKNFISAKMIIFKTKIHRIFR